VILRLLHIAWRCAAVVAVAACSGDPKLPQECKEGDCDAINGVCEAPQTALPHNTTRECVRLCTTDADCAEVAPGLYPYCRASLTRRRNVCVSVREASCFGKSGSEKLCAEQRGYVCEKSFCDGADKAFCLDGKTAVPYCLPPFKRF